MNLIGITNEINAELAYLRSQNNDVISEQERADILNSLIAVLTDDLVVRIEFYIKDRLKNQEFVKWSYDLNDRKYIQRKGPTAGEVVSISKNLPKSAHLICQPIWSQNFLKLDERTKSTMVKGTIWEQSANSRRELFALPDKEKRSTSMDLSVLEADLRLLQSEINAIDKKQIPDILDSIKVIALKECITGVNLGVVHKKDNIVLAEWRFLISPDLSLLRQGLGIDRVIDIAKTSKQNVQIIVKPIFSDRFGGLPMVEQQAILKGTIWENDLSPIAKRKKFLW